MMLARPALTQPTFRLRRRLGALAVVLLLGAFVPLVGPAAAAAATPARDIVFSLDGSGSIDSADWQLQKDGYSAALGDAVAFPRDGSVAVAINQWSGAGEVRTEVPLRLITSQADVDAVLAAIQGIVQFGNSTDPVTGLDQAVQLLTAGGRANADWTVCMSSDGVKNDGGGTIGGAASAARSAGVDRYSVIGIEDFGNRAELRAFYSPAVFGGGTFTLARNTAEFAGLIVGGCLNEPAEVVGIEVSQGVQNWKNTVPLVAARSTVVRVFVQVPAGAQAQRMTARLVGRRGGVELAESPLAASNTGGTILAQPDITARRDVLADSLVFELPASWRTGTLDLEVDGAGTSLSCHEAAGPTANDCHATVTFGPGSAADLRMVGIPVTNAGATSVPDHDALAETAERIRTSLPVSTMATSFDDQLYTSLPGPSPKLALVNSRLATQRALDLCFSTLGCNTLYYGQLNGSLGGGLAAGIPADVASGWDFGLHKADDLGFFRNVAPHEIGHLIGLNHSVRGPVVNDPTNGPLKLGPCQEGADATAADFPYFASVGGGDRSLMGANGAGADDQIWGLDSRFARGDVKNLAVVSPIGTRATFDLMGYCWIASPQDTWSSDYTWQLAINGLANRYGSGVSLVAAATTTGPHLLFTGRIDVGTGAATIDPPALVTGQVPTPPSGPYELRLLDAVGTTLAAVPFAPDSDGSRPGVSDPSGLAPDEPMFVVPVPQPATTVAKVQVWHGATKVGEVVGSAHPPTLAVTEPAGGSNQAGGTVHIAWSGADLDGDHLMYHVRYSRDGGTTWETLATDFDGTSLDVPRDDLGGGAAAIVEVQATDGVNLTVARSAPFAVVNSAPTVTITSPHDGEAFYSGVQRILLEGSALDAEDGDVSPSIRWTSDVDGAILTGPSGSIRADQLSEGPHTLTATATDASGGTGTATVHITVVRVAPAPAAPPATPAPPTTPGGPTDPGPGDPGAPADPGNPSGRLPITGQSLTGYGIAGGLLICAGVAFVFLARSRRRPTRG